MAMGSFSEHPNTNLLLFFHAGLVSEERDAQIREHLEKCEDACSVISPSLKAALQEWISSKGKKDLSLLVRNVWDDWDERRLKSNE